MRKSFEKQQDIVLVRLENLLGVKMKKIPIIIPAYEPGEQLVYLVEELLETGNEPIIIVDDGSQDKYAYIFEKVKSKDERVVVLQHHMNLGKGRALKTAFNFCLNEYPEMTGAVTADADGQHSAGDIYRCSAALYQDPQHLILGCRDFSLPDIPYKSRMGNQLTCKVCRYLCGISVSDTQTGLRGIPTKFMKQLLNVAGERFEYETNMLIAAKDAVSIKEVPIQTIYDSKDHHKTHFDPLWDSLKIYRIFGRMFLKYTFSSLSSSVIDIFLFACFCSVLKNRVGLQYIAIATILARIVSASYNYLMNYKVVFKSNSNHKASSIKYCLLALIQMCLSAFLVTIGSCICAKTPEAAIKIVVDCILFLVSFYVQREVIF